MLDILQIQTSVKDPTIVSITYSLLLAFSLSTALAVTYRKTFQGLSYSRNFLQTLALSSLVVCIAMQAIGDNVARGFGMMGALAIIRFRSSLKDPKDMVYIFCSLTVGIACGVYQFDIAAIGVAFFIASAFILFYFPMGTDIKFDGLLRFNLKAEDKDAEKKIQEIMTNYCRDFALVTLRELAQGNRLDYSYQIKIKSNKQYQDLVRDFKELPEMQGLSLLLQETTIEI